MTFEAQAQPPVNGVPRGAALHRVAALARDALGVAAVACWLRDTDELTVAGGIERPPDWRAQARDACLTAVTSGSPCSGADWRPWLAVPLVAPGGAILGACCALSAVPREWTAADRALLGAAGATLADIAALREQFVRQTARFDALADVSAAITTSGLDLAAVLRVIAERSAALCDAVATIRLLSEDGAWLELAAACHPDPAINVAAQELLHSRLEVARDPLFGEVIATAEPAVLDADAATGRARGHHTWSPFFLRYLPLGFLVVPLRAHGRVLGTLGLARITGGQSFTQDDMTFARELADRAAQAIDNARSHERVAGLLRTTGESLALLDTLFETAPVGFAYLDRDLRFVRVNPPLAALNGLPASEHLGKRVRDLVHGDTTITEPLMRHVLETGEAVAGRELSGPDADNPNRLRHVLASFYPVRDATGAVIGVGAVVADVTARREAQAAQRASDERFRALVQHAPDIISVVDAAGEPLYDSPAVARLLGWTREYLRDLRLLDLAHPDDRDASRARFARILTAPGSTETGVVRVRHADGSWRYLESTATNLLHNPAVGGVVFNSRDITERVAAEQRRREAEAKYRTLIEQIPVVTYIEAPGDAGIAGYMSPQIEPIIGYTPAELIGQPDLWFSRLHPDDQSLWTREIERTNASGAPFHLEHRLFARDGREVWLQNDATLVRDDTGTPLFWQGVIVDITERKRAEVALRDAEARYRTLVEQIPAVVYTDRASDASRSLYISPRIADLVGYTPEEWLATPDLWQSLLHPEDRARVVSESNRTDASGAPFSQEYRMLARDGGVVWVREESVLVRDAAGAPRFWQGIFIDITERKALEAQLAHQAFHDGLTGLPNRALLLDRIQQALALAARRATTSAVLFLDLDNFKVVNDTLGHDVGDALLTDVGRRLQACLREGDTAARFGGDEFAVVLADLRDASDAVDVAARIVAAFQRPFVAGDRAFTITTSIGIVLGGEPGVTPEDLLRRADLAMYRAKARGKNRYDTYAAETQASVLARMELLQDLRAAVERDDPGEEFVVHYQPTVALPSGDIVGLEALVRWRRPGRGLVAPAEFIPVAEETGLIVPLGHWVLREACGRARAWQLARPGRLPLKLSVNLSARQFAQRDLAARVVAVLNESGLPPDSLILEITESVMMDDAEETAAGLRALAELGVGLAIDDFGMGYSSLAQIRRFPLDYLKIDRHFVTDLGVDLDDTVIVSGIIGLAHALGMSVVAEGVETPQQMRHLLDLGCDVGQGYYFARPRPPEQIAGLLADWRSAPRPAPFAANQADLRARLTVLDQQRARLNDARAHAGEDGRGA